MRFGDDDEALSDIRQARSHDRARTGGQVRFGAAAMGPTRDVPCRDCGEVVELSALANQMMQAANEVLHRQGEPPLEDGEVTRCLHCGEVWEAKQHRLRAGVHEQALKIRKRGKATEFELDWLRRNGYRDTADALVQLASVKPGGKSKKRHVPAPTEEED